MAASPAFPKARKISRLLEAVAIFACGVITTFAIARNDGRVWESIDLVAP
jgi:hypothetical protein